MDVGSELQVPTTWHLEEGPTLTVRKLCVYAMTVFMSVSCELGRICRGTDVVYFKILFQQLSEKTEQQNTDFEPPFELGSSVRQSENTAHYDIVCPSHKWRGERQPINLSNSAVDSLSNRLVSCKMGTRAW